MLQALPNDFLQNMQALLKEDYPRFLESYSLPRKYGLRVNTKKISVSEFLKLSPFSLTPIPWIPNGFFYEETDRPAKHPYYSAGLYYLQEPSAMTPASRLDVQPGDYVLDLCAAPGGKATELGAKLKGQGFLVANDISASRARALLRNLELFGISNSMVTNEAPHELAKFFPAYFDKILVDAPCSGEGMFRKAPDVAKAWDPARPEAFGKLQREIVSHAISMLKPGGKLLYSTCTFSPSENEDTISYILENFPQMQLLDIESYSGFSEGNPQWAKTYHPALTKCVRIFPHQMEGEGHFLALMKKEGISAPSVCIRKTKLDKSSQKLLAEFFQKVSAPFSMDQMEVRGSNVYYVPVDTSFLKGIKFLRNGLFLGELKKNRFEPAQPLAMALSFAQYASCFNLSSTDPRIAQYLRGETVSVEDGECPKSSGWQLVCVDHAPLGWGKLVGHTLKNKYPAGWRQHIS